MIISSIDVQVQKNVAHRCNRCRRPGDECYCNIAVPYDSSVDIIILTHPKESRRRMSSGRMVRAVLRACHYIVSARPDESAQFKSLIQKSDRDTYLVYPSADAVLIDTAFVPHQKTHTRRIQLVFIEATWYGAKSLYNSSALLRQLPAVKFIPDRPSNFRIRKQPRPDCLSTVESVVLVLKQLEPENFEKSKNMLEVFDWVVERQISFENLNPRHTK